MKEAATARGVACYCAQAPQSRPSVAAIPEVCRLDSKCGPVSAWLGVGCAHRFPARARHVAELLAPGALEPPASVTEAVSSLTVDDAFIAAGESPAPRPRKLPTRFICSFPDCNASYNKAWKLDAHLCKHTGEVTRPKAWQRRGLTSRPRD